MKNIEWLNHIIPGKDPIRCVLNLYLSVRLIQYLVQIKYFLILSSEGPPCSVWLARFFSLYLCSDREIYYQVDKLFLFTVVKNPFQINNSNNQTIKSTEFL